jgi:hypothetical protein
MLLAVCVARVTGQGPCRELGHGFRDCEVQESTSASFEALRHTSYLFYRDQKLSEFSSYTFTPHVDGIVFQATFPAPEIFLYRTSDRQMRPLTHGFSDAADGFKWSDDGTRLRVRLANAKKWITLDVPPTI